MKYAMDEIEIETESIQEQVHHHAEGARERWIMWVALSSALLAALAAVTALLASHHSNEAMIDQIHASDEWNFYQAKGIKSSVLGSKLQILEAMSKKTDEADRVKAEEYKKEQIEIQEKAKEEEKMSQAHLERHMILARGVTLFQVAIAISAITILKRRRRYWLVSLGFGAAGIFFLVQGLV